jgi:hypothetical protein
MTSLEKVKESYEPIFKRALMVLISANVQKPYTDWFREYAEKVYADVARRINEDPREVYVREDSDRNQDVPQG